MLKNIATCALALALSTGAVTGAMAAEKNAAQKPAISKQELASISKECKASAKGNKQAFRSCVKDKKGALVQTKANKAKDAAKSDATKL